MAEFCLATGVAPAEYMTLTRGQRQAFITMANRMNKRR